MSEVQPGRPGVDREPLFWRAIPLGQPPWFQSLLVCFLSLGVALGLRLLVLGFPAGVGPSSTFLPAFIVATLYGGPRWGWGIWVVGMAIGLFSPWNPVYSLPQQGAMALFALSGAATVMVASGLRTALVRLRHEVVARQRSAEQLRESESRFRGLADSAPALLWLSRAGGAREFVTSAYVAFIGGTDEDALVADWRTRLHPDDLNRILKEQTAGESSRRPFSLEARYRRADGEWRWPGRLLGRLP